MNLPPGERACVGAMRPEDWGARQTWGVQAASIRPGFFRLDAGPPVPSSAAQGNKDPLWPLARAGRSSNLVRWGAVEQAVS
jgi:hypothetical protein